MKKLLLLTALLGFIAAPALGQTALGTIGPGAVPCAYTSCKFANGSAAAPSISFAGSATTGMSYGGSSNLTFPLGGSSTALIMDSSSGNPFISGNTGGQFVGFQSNGDLNLQPHAGNILYMGIGTEQFGQADVDTAPVAQTLRSQGALAGGTSNVAGANWTFLASPGKGTGVGGSFIFRTTPAGSTGTVVGTPTTVMTLTGAGAITMPLVTTGTNADFLCLSAGAVVLLQTSACTISSARFKTEIKPYRLALSDAVYRMPVVTFRLKDGAKNKDPNARVVQLGLIAENVAKIMPLCAIYESDMKTPKSYRQECLIAALVKTVQEQHAANDNLARRVAALERRR